MNNRSKNWSSQKKYIIEKIENGEHSLFVDASPLRKKDKDIVIAAVTQWGNLLKHADDIWKANKDIVLLAVTQFGGALHYASDELKADREVVKIAVTQDGESLRDASEGLRADQDIVLLAIIENYGAIKYASAALQGDKAFILAAVKENGQILEHATSKLKADKEVVMAAVMQHGQAFKHAAEELRLQKEIIVTAVTKDGKIFDSTNDEWTSDREIMLAAASHDGNIFQYAPDEMKDDRSFVLEAVKVGGMALKYSSEALKEDKEVVEAAVAQNGSALEFASSSLQADKEVVTAAVQQNGSALEYASSDLRADEEIVMLAVAQSGQALRYADEKLTSNIVIVRAAVKQDGKALLHASTELKSNKSIAMDAVQQDGYALKYVNWDLRKDENIVLSALSNESKAVRYVNSDFFEFGHTPKGFLDYLKNEKDGRAMLHEWVDSKYMPDRLKNLVRQDNDIADVKNKYGKCAIDRAIPQCKEAMEIALRLFGLYDVTECPLLHQNNTTCVLRADRYEIVVTEDGIDTKQQIPSVLKIMVGVDKVMAELNARKGIHRMDTTSILSVKAVLVASSLTDAATYAAIQDAAAECGAILHPPIDGFMIQTYGAISDRLMTECQLMSKDEGAALVLDFADRTLDAALRYDRIASGDRPHLVKQIAKSIAKALLELHENGCIHGDLKPLNIMRVGDRWKTTDLDISCPIGGKYNEKKPSSGYCPPEVVKKLEGQQHIGASVAHDLWSFGAILYHLETGRSLWQLDQSDNIVQEQMYDFMHWKKPSVRRKKLAPAAFSTVDTKELVVKLLDPDPVRRCAHFRSNDGDSSGHGEEMNLVLQDGYFDEDTKIFKALRSIQSDVSTIKEMSITQEDELRKTREVLMHAIYEADEVQTPTTFVVLKKKLPPPLSPEEEEALFHSELSLFRLGVSLEDIHEKLLCFMQLMKINDSLPTSSKENILDKLQEVIDFVSNEDLTNEDIEAGLKNMMGELLKCIDDSGISLDGDLSDILEQLKPYAQLLEGSGISLQETMSQWKDNLDQANEWVTDLASVGKVITEANPERFFDIVSDQFGSLVQDQNVMYFYFVDELTGKPVRADGYPIEIQTPGDFVPKILPLVQASMRAVSLVNGAAGVCQMFGFPVPKIPNVFQDQMNNSVEVMKMGSSVATFAAVHKKVEDDDGETESVRGACLRELERFLKEYDENDAFAGLRRIGDVDGGAIWTILSDEGVKDQLEKRSKMRVVEEHLQMAKLQAKIDIENMMEQNKSKKSQSSSQNTQNSNFTPINGIHQNGMSKPELDHDSNQNSSTTSNGTHKSLPASNGSGLELALIQSKPKPDSTFFSRLLSPWSHLGGPWSHLGGPTVDQRFKALNAENATLKEQLATANAKMKQTSKDMKAAADVIHQAANNMNNLESDHSDCVLS